MGSGSSNENYPTTPIDYVTKHSNAALPLNSPDLQSTEVLNQTT